MKSIIESVKAWFTDKVVDVAINTIKKKSPILKQVLENPEGLMAEVSIENDEILVKIKRKPEIKKDEP